jgi:Ubiquitin-activating enzyme E1 FCCH domain
MGLFIDKAYLTGTITNVDDSPGDIRITAAAHGLTTGDTVYITGVGGTTEANGTFVVTVLSSSQFTLDSTTFTNAWTGGGYVYTYWRLQLSLAASDYDCHVTLGYKKFASNVVTAIETVGFVVSSATTTLLTGNDPTYAYSIESINLFSTEGSGDINLTLQLLDQAGTAYKIAFASIPAGYRWLMSGDGTTFVADSTGGALAAGAIP